MTIDPLSIPFLLKQIHSDEVDQEIFAPCQQAERLSRRDFRSAFPLIQATVDVAVRSGRALDIGVAFLYLAIVRHRTTDKPKLDQARVDSDTAIKWLKNDIHHLMLAHLIRASLCCDDDKPRLALRHLRAADDLCATLIEKWHRRDNRIKEQAYITLRAGIAESTKQIRLAPPPHAPLADQTDEPETIPAPIPLQEPTSAVWSDKVRKVHIQPPITDTLMPPIGRATTGHLWVNDQRYQLEPLDLEASNTEEMRLIPGQTYTVVEVDAPRDGPRRYLLVRQQSQSDRIGQYVVVTDATRKWAESADEADIWAEVRVIGADETNAPIYGVVEAFLSPESESPPTPPGAASPIPITQSLSDDIDEDLLICIDTFTYASEQQPTLASDLVVIQDQFEQYLKRRWGLIVIPIAPDVTQWDANLGHKPIGQVQRPDLPDGAIVRVLRNGYTRNGRVIRDAEVIVNRYP